MSAYKILKQALNSNTVDDTVLEVKSVMQERIANLQMSSELFAGIELSGDIVAFEAKKIAVA